MAYSISLSQKELDLVLAAVAACTPSGGGSAMLRLGRELTAQTNVACEVGSPLHVTCMRAATQEFLGDDIFMELEDAGKLPA